SRGGRDRRAPLVARRAARYPPGLRRAAAAARHRSARAVGETLDARMKKNDATYVYCVVRTPRGTKPSLARAPRGLAGAGAPRFLSADGLFLVVASAPLSLYGSEAIDRGLKDLTWVGACAAGHEAVVERMTREGAVVPMKLFTL